MIIILFRFNSLSFGYNSHHNKYIEGATFKLYGMSWYKTAIISLIIDKTSLYLEINGKRINKSEIDISQRLKYIKQKKIVMCPGITMWHNEGCVEFLGIEEF